MNSILIYTLEILKAFITTVSFQQVKQFKIKPSVTLFSIKLLSSWYNFSCCNGLQLVSLTLEPIGGFDLTLEAGTFFDVNSLDASLVFSLDALQKKN